MWVECLSPVDLWEVDLKDELYLGFKKCDTNKDRKTERLETSQIVDSALRSKGRVKIAGYL